MSQGVRVLVVLGTRPEAIKLAPVIRALSDADGFECRVCTTGQHRELLKSTLALFQLQPHYQLELMQPRQHLTDLASLVLSEVGTLLRREPPGVVLVQGDTTTAFAASLASFYEHIPVAHLEAGLRTDQLRSPFPEEKNRRWITQIARLHFAPTSVAQRALLEEGLDPSCVWLTGNTVVDALHWIESRISEGIPLQLRSVLPKAEARTVVITMHRRESLPMGLHRVCQAVHELASEYPQVHFIWPVHPNPQVSDVVGTRDFPPNVQLLAPLDYPSFVWALRRCALVLTDSGGVQEEACSLGKPTLVLRDTTERPEAVAAGTATLVGTDTRHVVEVASSKLERRDSGPVSSHTADVYGDGRASQRVVQALRSVFFSTDVDRI